MPFAILKLFTPRELEIVVCGEPNLNIELLRSVTEYSGGLTKDSELVRWLWECLAEMDQEERCLFIRFSWGRSRLPRGRQDFKVQWNY